MPQAKNATSRVQGKPTSKPTLKVLQPVNHLKNHQQTNHLLELLIAFRVAQAVPRQLLISWPLPTSEAAGGADFFGSFVEGEIVSVFVLEKECVLPLFLFNSLKMPQRSQRACLGFFLLQGRTIETSPVLDVLH